MRRSASEKSPTFVRNGLPMGFHGFRVFRANNGSSSPLTPKCGACSGSSKLYPSLNAIPNITSSARSGRMEGALRLLRFLSCRRRRLSGTMLIADYTYNRVEISSLVDSVSVG